MRPCRNLPQDPHQSSPRCSRWIVRSSPPKTDGAIARLDAELALLWERAGLAARGVVTDAIRAANPHLGG